MKRKKCVDYISHFVFFFLVSVCFGVCNTEVENTVHRGGVLGEGEGDMIFVLRSGS
jgi:hypothetical protein